jgi:phosphotriesterase-related protein
MTGERSSGDAEPVIRTTSGDVHPADLGPTSMHEHLFIDARPWYFPRASEGEIHGEDRVDRDNIPAVRWSALSFKDNLVLDDADMIRPELQCFRDAGGGGIVEMTSVGLRGDPQKVAAIADQTGVLVILGCGFFAHVSHDEAVCRSSIEELEAVIEQQVAGTGSASRVRPGTIGEIGMSAPPEACERRVLRASARVARRYGMSVNIHVDANGRYAAQHVADCAEEGLPVDRIVCGHMDEHLDESYQIQVLQTGANIALDTFGTDFYFSGVFPHPTDDQRMRLLANLVDLGHEERIVVGQDVGFKSHLHRFGGFGYDHIMKRILPELKHSHGVSAAAIDQILVHNPRRLLASTPPP